MATFNHLNLEETSTVTAKVATVTMTRNSSAMHQELMSLADPESSLSIARVSSAAPASSDAGLVVRPIGYSTTVSVANTVATSGDSTVFFPSQLLSSAAPATNSSGLNVWVVGGNGVSTTVSVASLPANSSKVEVTAMPANSSLVGLNAIAAGYVSTAAPAANSSGLNVWVVGGNGVSTTVSVASLPANSSQVQLNAIAAGYVSTAAPAAGSSGLNVWVVGGNGVSTTVSIANSPTVSIGTNLQSSVAPSSGSSGLMTREIIDVILTTASSNAFGTSTSLTLQSSGAGIRNYVTAYSITCTNAVATKLAFYSSGTMLWPIVLQAVSSAIAGANLAVSAPAYLFRTPAAEAFTLQMGGSSVAGFKVAVSYFRAP